MTARIIDGKAIAAKVRAEVAAGVHAFAAIHALANERRRQIDTYGAVVEADENAFLPVVAVVVRRHFERDRHAGIAFAREQ